MGYRRAVLTVIAVAFAASVPPAEAQLPPRDPASARSTTATAVIRGRVVDAQTGRPLRRVRLTLTSPELGRQNISSSTDTDGIFEIANVPAGRFTLRAERSGYLSLRYGQRRPLEQGKPLEVREGEVIENANLALPPMAVISGRVVDELGEPIAGVWVSAQRLIYRDNRRRLMPAGPLATTDDDGEYRILGLTPGTYLVAARTLEKWSVDERGRQVTLGYAQTFYPGVADPSGATRVTVTTGQFVTAIEFGLVPGRAATISGTAVTSSGEPMDNVILVHEILGTDGGLVGLAGSSPIGPEGRFEIRDVPPGEYKLQASGSQEAAVVPLAINGIDLTNMALTTSRGWSLRGNIVIDSDAPSSLRRTQVTIAPIPMAGRDGMGMRNGPVPRQVVNDDWTFSVSNVVGAARLRVNAPDTWAVKEVTHGTRNIADVPLDFGSGEELSGLQIVLTDRVATVAGPVVGQNGEAAADATVLLFPTDTANWYEGSRLVKVARPDARGEYRIQGVLPGDYWLVALDYVEEGVWNDPEYLESIRRDAQRVTLAEATAQSIPLKLVVR